MKNAKWLKKHEVRLISRRTYLHICGSISFTKIMDMRERERERDNQLLVLM